MLCSSIEVTDLYKAKYCLVSIKEHILDVYIKRPCIFAPHVFAEVVILSFNFFREASLFVSQTIKSFSNFIKLSLNDAYRIIVRLVYFS